MRKYYSWNASARTYENGKYLKSIANTLAIACDKIIHEYCINKNDKYYNNKCNKKSS